MKALNKWTKRQIRKSLGSKIEGAGTLVLPKSSLHIGLARHADGAYSTRVRVTLVDQHSRAALMRLTAMAHSQRRR